MKTIKVKCSACDGTGNEYHPNYEKNGKLVKCPVCKGKGKVSVSLEYVKVKINPDGKSCKEMNPLGSEPIYKVNTTSRRVMEKHYENLKKWKQAEEKLREFKINVFAFNSDTELPEHWDKYEPGTIHEAKIVNSTTALIIKDNA